LFVNVSYPLIKLDNKFDYRKSIYIFLYLYALKNSLDKIEIVLHFN